ncbi:hypothetical protein AB0B57_03410 [Micromonospora sp. NPDC049101]|uniref:hypothetical protein n=1 Tax=unclassified Micromonospora TaxID=2617518 RepID=UPI00340D3968
MMLEDAGNLGDLVGSIGVIISLLLIARQTRQLTQQTKISNEVGSTEAAYSALERIHQISQIMIDDPQMQQYFHEDKDFPADKLERARVMMVAQVLADTIDYGLMVCDLRSHMENYQGWPAFAVSSMNTSPALRRVVDDHPEYWPRLNRQWREHRRELARP